MTAVPDTRYRVRPRGLHADEPPVGELMSKLGADLSLLVHQEVDLVRAEMRQQLSQAGGVAASLAAGAGLLYAGVLALIAAGILGLARAGLSPALAALVPGVVLLVIGIWFVNRGKQALKRVNLVPRRAVRAARDTVEQVKEQLT